MKKPVQKPPRVEKVKPEAPGKTKKGKKNPQAGGGGGSGKASQRARWQHQGPKGIPGDLERASDVRPEHVEAFAVGVELDVGRPTVHTL